MHVCIIYNNNTHIYIYIIIYIYNYIYTCIYLYIHSRRRLCFDAGLPAFQLFEWQMFVVNTKFRMLAFFLMIIFHRVTLH